MTAGKIAICDLGRIITGKTPSTGNSAFFDGEYPFVTPSDLDWKTYYCRTTERTVTDEARNSLQNQFIPSDAVIVTCIGNTIGKCGISSVACLTNQQINSIIPNKGINSKFVYYLIVHNIGVIRGFGLGGGSATPILNKTAFSSILLSVPSKRNWDGIASFLSTYDDLIENNQRRMALLEDAARQVYQEWFVRLRFPGYEHTRIVDGVPEGWQGKKLGDLAKINHKNLSNSSDGEIEYIDIASVSPGQINETTRYDLRDAPSRARRVVKHGDIIWSCVRPNRRSHAVIWNPPENLIASTGFAVISSRYLPTSFLYQALTTDSFVGYLENHTKGAAYPAVVAGDFKKAVILVPKDSLLSTFNDFVEPQMSKMHNLRFQNQKLRTARDLLLPKLMSGEISV
jgi:type I restriction enzyme S subunit